MVKEKYVRKAILADALELAPKIKKEDRAEIMASEQCVTFTSFSRTFYL